MTDDLAVPPPEPEPEPVLGPEPVLERAPIAASGPKPWHCPHCGAINRPGSRFCWICKEALPGGDSSILRLCAKELEDAEGDILYIGPDRSPPMRSNIGSIMLVIAFFALFFGVARLGQPFAVFAFATMLPAFILTCLRVSKRMRYDDPMKGSEILGLFILRWFTVIAIAVGGVFALGVALFVICMIGSRPF